MNLSWEKTLALPCLSQEEATWMLHDRVSQGCKEGVVSALSYGAIINSFDFMQQTPLLLASKLGHLEICKVLVENGGNPNVYDAAMKTPMHYVCELGHVSVMEYLLTLPELGLNLFYSTYNHPLSVEQLNKLVVYFKENPSAQRPSCWVEWLALAASNPAMTPQAFNTFADEICPSDWMQLLLSTQYTEADKRTVDLETAFDSEMSSYPLLSFLVEADKRTVDLETGLDAEMHVSSFSSPRQQRHHPYPSIKAFMKEHKPFTSKKVPNQFVFKSFKQAKSKRPSFRKCFSGPRFALESRVGVQNNKFRTLLYCTVVYKNTAMFEYLLQRFLEQMPSSRDLLFVGTSTENGDVQKFLEVIAKQFAILESTLSSLQLTDYLKAVFDRNLKPTEHSLQRDILFYLLSGEWTRISR